MYPICTTCGVQYDAAQPIPALCRICEDARQYVGWGGQRWTNLDELRTRHRNVFTDLEPGVTSIHTDPSFAIGQRAFLIEAGAGNLLWDCITLLDDDTLDQLALKGGLRPVQWMAISHPHYYSTMIEWSQALGNVPIYVHEAERDWITRPSANLHFWSGDTHSLPGGITLIRSGGHFEGYQVAHWKNLLFAGDQPQVCMDRNWVSFLYSYPNMIPFNARQIDQIVRSLDPFDYDKIYGAFGRHVLADAKAVVARSAKRYLEAIAP